MKRRALDGAQRLIDAVVPSRQRLFARIHRRNEWGEPTTSSGPGSTLEQTEQLRAALPGLVEDFDVWSILDVPCGDFHWMREVELRGIYIGADVVPSLIRANRRRFGTSARRFVLLDAVRDSLPRADLILCRDLLVHLSNADVFQALRNFVESEGNWLLTTTFREPRPNIDIATGSWRPLNLQLPPFSFPEPERTVLEGCTVDGGIWLDKAMGLWRINQVRDIVTRSAGTGGKAAPGG